MELKQIDHINKLIFEDEFRCNSHLKGIENSDYSEDAKAMLSGYFRKRSKLNQQILSKNGFYDERNINHQKSKPC